ncbi:MAG: hypothetical protein ACLRSG_06120 [Christensenellales bacterium]|jgi:hypothetical protein
MWIVIIAVAVFCLALTVPCLVLSDFVSKNKNKGLKRINAVKYSSFVLLLAVLLTYLVVVVCIPDLTNMPIRNFVTSLLCSVPIMFLFFGVFSSLTGAFVLLYLNSIYIVILAVKYSVANIIVIPTGLGALIGFGVLFLILSLTAERHFNFIELTKSIQQGASIEELQNMFEEQPALKDEEDGKLIIIYEKTQWRGFLRGGTIVRSVKVTLVDEKVVKVTTKNMDVPVW